MLSDYAAQLTKLGDYRARKGDRLPGNIVM